MTKARVATRAAPTRDFPFYDGRPIWLSFAPWLLALGLSAAGFVALMILPSWLPGRSGSWAGIALFVGLPLLGLRLAAGPHWAAMFHRPTVREILIGLAFAPLTLLVSGIVAVAVMRLSLTAANPAVAMLLELRGLDLVLFIAATAPQLIGEELVTIIPFLALLTLFSGPLKLSRWLAIAGAWVGSAVIFALLHLSTYQWHVGQVLLVIGTARLMLTLPFLITKNLWASAIAHITNDWIVFGVVLAAAVLKRSGGA